MIATERAYKPSQLTHIGVPSDLCGFTTLRNIRDFMQSEEQTKQVKILLHQRLHHLYKKLYKQSSIKKATNAVKSTFVAFLYVAKRSFGNVFLFEIYIIFTKKQRYSISLLQLARRKGINKKE